MPAAIRVDVELFSIRASDELPDVAKGRVRDLATKLQASVKAVVEEFVGLLADGPDVSAVVFEGLGEPWPPPDRGDAIRLGELAEEYVRAKLAGKDTNALGPVNGYTEGAFHVVIKCDLG